jgi:hypothetical protein
MPIKHIESEIPVEPWICKGCGRQWSDKEHDALSRMPFRDTGKEAHLSFDIIWCGPVVRMNEPKG